MYSIIRKKDWAGGTAFSMTLAAPRVAAKALPGQFVVLRVNETGERIPLTIAEFDRTEGTLTLFVQIVGKSTALLGSLRAGESILDVMGPLGNPTPIEKVGKVVCVGGGTGVAIVYPVTRAFKDAGNHVIAIMGAKTRSALILESEMKNASHELRVSTDDGSYGNHGLVTKTLEDILKQNQDCGLVYAVGPVPMMKAVSDVTQKYGVKTMVSLNSVMIDGTGMCGGCRVSVGGETKFCCVDGPEFDGHQVNYDELMMRQQTYHEHERSSHESFKCRIKYPDQKNT